MSDQNLLEQELDSLGAELRSPPSIAGAVMRRIAGDVAAGIQPEEIPLLASPDHMARQSPAMDLGTTQRSAPRGYRWTAAVACLLLILWFGAQTKAWGQVAQNLQRAAVAESSVVPSPSHSSREVGAVLRFVLLVHVFSLLGGMLGLMIVWVRSQWDWFLAIWRPSRVPRRTWKIHAVALALYGVGIVLGSCWSQATFGTLWRWDPREAFALLTLCVGGVWYLSVDEELGNPARQVIRRATIAAMSFGLVMLMQGLAIPYSRHNQSFGFPSIILILLLANLVTLFTAQWFARRQDASRV